MKRHGIRTEETSDEEEDSIDEVEPQGEVDPVRLFKLVMVASSKPWSKVLTYDGSLNAE